MPFYFYYIILSKKGSFMNIYQKEIEFSDGRRITIETGKLAKQADGSAVVQMGKTMLLATVVSAKEPKENADFMPLSVDYREKFASSGRFPGGFLKREARPSDYEVLISRLVDRALRPLFPDDYHAETFVTITLISAEKEIMPDALAGLAASAALTVSDIPFNGPISEVRAARINGQYKINPTFTELEAMDIDLMVGATNDNILMVEGEMKEVAEQEMIEAINLGHEEIKKQCQAQIELAKEIGVQKRDYHHEEVDQDLKKEIRDQFSDKIYQAVKQNDTKKDRTHALNKVKEECQAFYAEKEEEVSDFLIDKYFGDTEKEVVRNMILNEKIRPDNRMPDQIRDIWCEIDYLPAVHGSAIFTRGETQSLSTVTLGTRLDEQVIDEVLIQGSEKFVLHYNFPPFSTGDAKPVRGVSRREVGHGNLAHRALKNMVPTGEENPYAIRVVSDILESNGSSSMATVCAGSLSLMDAGIHLKKTVSGIAMGLITDEKAYKGDFENGQYAILSDILGDEDHLGDMDFKVTGTKDGITACQMDIKVQGLSNEVLKSALEQAKEGRLFILNKMEETISEPRPDLKAHAPRIVQKTIPKEMVGPLIGPSGQVIQDIQKKTGATVVIDEDKSEENKANVEITAEDKGSIDEALKRINEIVQLPEVGKVYTGKVKSIVSYGAFVEIFPGKTGLLHISEIDWRRIQSVDQELKEGQEIDVKLIDEDKNTGKLTLSRKVLLERPESNHQPGNTKK